MNEPMPGTIQCQKCGWWIVESFMHPAEECKQLKIRLEECTNTNKYGAKQKLDPAG